jgi:azurin
MTNRGWSSTGTEPYGLEKLKWSGKTPFEIQRVNIQPDGFIITFTQPVDRKSAANPDSYQIMDFTYKYHRIYGSPAIHLENRTIYKVEVNQDAMQARIFVEGLRPGYVNEIRLSGVRNQGNQPLLHTTGYYTINELPGSFETTHHDHIEAGTIAEVINIQSSKRITHMPAAWKEGPDQTITIGTLPGMQFDNKEVVIKAGSKIKWTLNNPDDMMHNLLIVAPGKIDEVAQMAIDLGLQGQEKGYVPESDWVLYHTNLLPPHSSDVIYFVAPEEPGDYPFVCTFPGHALLMRGIIKVTPQQ